MYRRPDGRDTLAAACVSLLASSRACSAPASRGSDSSAFDLAADMAGQREWGVAVS
jgi:hypothetical protein